MKRKEYVMRISQAENILTESFLNQLANPNGRDATNIIGMVMGGSGSGKSTMIKDLCKMARPQGQSLFGWFT
jgi:ABC-type lipoprotein export system ATPase subunit